MESVGSQLREARLSQGVTLEQVSAKTRIPLKNLKAMEDDDLSAIHSAFFYRSFVKQFAQQLKLDYSLLAPAIEQTASTIPEPRIPGQAALGQPESPGPKVPGLKMQRPKNLRWFYSLMSFCVMLAACSSFYGAWQQSRSNWRAQLAAVVSFFTPGTRSARLEPIQQSVAPFNPLWGVAAAAEPRIEKLPNVPVAAPNPAPAPLKLQAEARSQPDTTAAVPPAKASAQKSSQALEAAPLRQPDRRIDPAGSVAPVSVDSLRAARCNRRF